jgi:SAM-dependent methyltransferase
MLAELLARSGQAMLRGIPPDGRSYWRARFWDRDAVQRHPGSAESFLRQKAVIVDYLERYAGQARRALEFACGTGEFTACLAAATPAEEIVALDISQTALGIAAGRVRHANLKLVHGDFWADNQLGTADVVLCVDAIHHLGDIRRVLERLRSHVAPGGVLIGNVWTADHFHEFQRKRYGIARHVAETSAFFTTALLIRASGGLLRTASYRTQLLPSGEVREIVATVLGEVLDVTVDRYFMSFVGRP